MYPSIYRVQSSTRRLPIRALFGFTLKLVESYSSLSPQSLRVVVCPWCQPWVASHVPSGENATDEIQWECPSRVLRWAPLTASHNQSVSSWDPDTICVPSGENATEVTSREWPSIVRTNKFHFFWHPFCILIGGSLLPYVIKNNVSLGVNISAEWYTCWEELLRTAKNSRTKCSQSFSNVIISRISLLKFVWKVTINRLY